MSSLFKIFDLVNYLTDETFGYNIMIKVNLSILDGQIDQICMWFPPSLCLTLLTFIISSSLCICFFWLQYHTFCDEGGN